MSQVAEFPTAETTTFVHPPQLFDSLDSEMTPVFVGEVLSAQTRTEYVPAEVKLYDGEVAVLLAPAERADIEAAARLVIVPPPLAAFATWKKFENPAPVETGPLFVIIEVNVLATLTVAVLGEEAPAERSG
jgi:hypothetical protein